MKRGLDEDGRSLSAEKDRQREANVLKAKLHGDRTGKPGMLDSQLLEQIGLKVEGLTPLAFLCLLPVVNRLDMILSAQKEDEVPYMGLQSELVLCQSHRFRSYFLSQPGLALQRALKLFRQL